MKMRHTISEQLLQSAIIVGTATALSACGISDPQLLADGRTSFADDAMSFGQPIDARVETPIDSAVKPNSVDAAAATTIDAATVAQPIDATVGAQPIDATVGAQPIDAGPIAPAIDAGSFVVPPDAQQAQPIDASSSPDAPSASAPDAALPDAAVAPSVDANNTPPAIVSDVATFWTTEFGHATTSGFHVWLSKAPSGQTCMNPSVDDPTMLNVLSGSLCFDASNWSVPQLVVTQTIDDAIVEYDPSTYIHFEITGASEFAALSPWAMQTFVMDDDGVQRVSRGTNYPTGVAGSQPVMTADGRYYFMSASSVAAFDGCYHNMILEHDRVTGVLSDAVRAYDGSCPNNDSWSPSISSDGRYLTFTSEATNLLPPGALPSGVPAGTSQAYLLDRSTNSLELVSLTTSGAASNGYGYSAGVSLDGRYVAMFSSAEDLTSDQYPSQHYNVFIRDRSLATTTLVSQSSPGVAQSRTDITVVWMDDTGVVTATDGGAVIQGQYSWQYDPATAEFSSVPGASGGAVYVQHATRSGNRTMYTGGSPFGFWLFDATAQSQTFVENRTDGTAGGVGDVNGWIWPGDGDFVAWIAPRYEMLPSGSSDSNYDMFVHDVANNTTVMAPTIDGQLPNAQFSSPNSFSGDGNTLSFSSQASNLTPDSVALASQGEAYAWRIAQSSN